MTKQFIQNTSDLANWIGTQYPEIKGTKATAIVRTIFGCITKSLFEQQQAGVDNPHVQLHGFGSVRLMKTKARKARNPKTGEPVDVGEKVKLKWSASTSLKDAFNTPDSSYFDKYTSFGTNGTEGEPSIADFEGEDMFSGQNNSKSHTYNTAGSGLTPPIREGAGVGGMSESIKRRPGRPRKNPLPPSMEQPAKRSRGRPKKNVDSSLGGASTAPTTRRARKRTTSTNSTTPTQSATPKTTPTKTRTRAKSKVKGMSDAKLRSALETFFASLNE